MPWTELWKEGVLFLVLMFAVVRFSKLWTWWCKE